MDKFTEDMGSLEIKVLIYSRLIRREHDRNVVGPVYALYATSDSEDFIKKVNRCLPEEEAKGASIKV